MHRRILSLALVLGLVLPLMDSGCGGGSSSGNPPSMFTIGGTVLGLSGTGLVLQDNGEDNLKVSANGAFTFSSQITSGSSYNASVLTQPSGPAQVCTVTNGSGKATSNVTNIQVVCGAPPQYTIGGTVSGLSGTGLFLEDNGGDNLSITGNGSFTFSTSISSGSTYSVTVFAEPSAPAQLCSVSNGSGTATTNVTNVQVACTTSTTAAGEWTWMGGSSSLDQPGVYGTLGIPAAGNIPGARIWASSWTDPSGNFWLFGGTGIDSAGGLGTLNDLWKYSNGEWTWVSGSNVVQQPGVYGTKGQPVPGNTPGGRSSAVSWTDGQGNLWLFGGFGSGYTGAGEFNDLWKYANGQWTWVSGSSTAEAPGVYGTIGVPDPANVPGARFTASGWTDSEGNLWLFGGEGFNAQDNIAVLNDLWKFSGGEWTWMGGSNVGNAFGVYGTKGTPDAANVPGSRSWATTWTDAQGNFWLFGGEGNDINGAICSQFLNCWLNDLWKYANGKWTWMAGSDTTGEPGFYGLEYVAAPGNFPGGREESAGWTDAQGNLWLFGGDGLDSRVNSYGLGEAYGEMNDLWEYSNGEWSWMGGSNLAGAAGSYGTLGVAAQANLPPGRQGAASWIDKSGNLWLFGGSTFGTPKFNDLWEFQPWGSAGPPLPPPPTVTYTIGGTTYGLTGSGLVLQDNLADNITVNADGAFTFPTALGASENYSVSILTQPSNPQQVCILNSAVGTANANVTSIQVMCTNVVAGHNQWTWMGGNGPANYGTLGQPATSNLPPARSYAASWTDASGNVWLFGGNNGYLGNLTNIIGPCGPTQTTYFDYNDLWKYSGGQWVWMGGSQSTTSTQAGVYGTQGQPASTNFPGARHGAVTWTDASGNFWLFGGIGIDSAGKQGDLNDLWKFSSGQWTWIAGSNLIDQSGAYGALGTPAASNMPSPRDGAVGWTDASGNLWLFGGFGFDSTTTTCQGNLMPAGYLNDLWKFANGQWTWMGGSNLANQSGTYGTQGAPSATNIPGPRQHATAWTDPTGTFWLFGGGATSEGFNDLWKYANGQWTWVAGANTANQKGVYGILGVPTTSNAPGARIAAAGWTDASGNLWLFGGDGLDAQGSSGSLNDLWRFSGGLWTWVGGPELPGNPGSYGTLDVSSPTNLPPARYGASVWSGSNGSFWLFGGGFNDLWEYQP